MGRHSLNLSFTTESLADYTAQDAYRDNDVHGHATIRDDTNNEIELRLLQRRVEARRMQNVLDKTDDVARSSIDRDQRAVREVLASRGLPAVSFRRKDAERPYGADCKLVPEINEYLQRAGIGRFDPRLITIDIDPDRVVQGDQATSAKEAEDFMKELAEEMKTKGTELYNLMQAFKNRDSVSAGGKREMRAQERFCAIANAVSKRLWERFPSRSSKDKDAVYGDVFLSMGETYVKGSADERSQNGPKPENFPYQQQDTPLSVDEVHSALGKPDIILDFLDDKAVDRENPFWKAIAGVGEVKADRNKDLLMSTIAQIQRYLMNMIKHHPLTGEVLCFGLCGDILRGHFLSPQRFGSTRGFSMEDEEDYLDIVKMIALFSGPVGNFMPSWGPKPGDTISIRTPKQGTIDVTLDKVSLLESRFGPYGRRTTVWQAEVKRSKGKGKKGSHGIDIAPGEVLVIKASWLLSRLAKWEATVYEHIAEKEAERVKRTGVKRDPDIGLPEFIGQVIDASQTESLGPHHLGQWESRQVPKRNIPGRSMEQACASIFVTKCFPAQTIDRANLSLSQLAKIYLGLFKTLNYLASLGVHYRDLNLGNILYDLSSGTRCLLTDFDFARLNLRSRGEPDLDEEKDEAWDISIDDAISGNVLFQSRSAHAARECYDRLEVAIFAEVEAKTELAKVQAEKDPSAKTIMRRKRILTKSSKSVDALIAELRGHRHRYVDDLESAIYTILWVIAARDDKRVPQAIQGLRDAVTKARIWETDLEKVAVEAEAGGDWCDALFAMQEAISQARSELAQADTADRPLPLVSHEIETRCFDQCISSMKELIQALEPVSSEVTEVAALLEDTGLTEQQAIPGHAQRSGPEGATRPVQTAAQLSITPEGGPAPSSAIGQHDAATSRYNTRSKSAKTDHKK